MTALSNKLVQLIVQPNQLQSIVVAVVTDNINSLSFVDLTDATSKSRKRFFRVNIYTKPYTVSRTIEPDAGSY